MTAVKLIAGLGNPGPEYENTRHNAGARLVEQLARQKGIQLAPERKYSGLTGCFSGPEGNVRLLIPTTFMNRSGQAVAALAGFYRIPPEAILVVHDELDLLPGTARLKQGGGHGGHNGLRDIIASLGNQNSFHRLRLGIGHPGQKQLVSAYVLGRAPRSEQDKLQDSIDLALASLPDILSGNWTRAMQQLHSQNA